jgi:hypothetical protein
MTDWRSVPIPRRMQALQKDSRGYPIPFVVMRDDAGQPHFTINDTQRQHRVIKERRCAICGTRMARLWFVGGPLSAFHEHGAYGDSAMHHECMRYAMQVCPYLALRNYNGRIDAGRLKPSDIQKKPKMILVDTTQDDSRPTLFVAVAADRQTLLPQPHGLSPHLRPQRPYLAVEYWQNGQQLDDEEGRRLVEEYIASKPVSRTL